MADAPTPIKTGSNVLSELAKAKALFQQRTVVAIMTQQPAQSKPDQELAVKLEGK